jgi:WD40 repeat protein
VNSGVGGGSGTSVPPSGPTRLTCTTELENDPSHSPISYIAHFHSDDDTRRLICVSGDNMVRLYRGNLNAFTAGRTDGANLYVLRNVTTGIPTRGNVMRSGFWKGERGGKSEVSVFFDDGEMDAVTRPPRRLTECDVLVTGGPDNTAQVFDVTDEGNAILLERLEGHRDRVTGVTVRRSRKPIIATTSADSTVRIWVPVKS